jgi:hypothetical protein
MDEFRSGCSRGSRRLDVRVQARPPSERRRWSVNRDHRRRHALRGCRPRALRRRECASASIVAPKQTPRHRQRAALRSDTTLVHFIIERDSLNSPDWVIHNDVPPLWDMRFGAVTDHRQREYGVVAAAGCRQGCRRRGGRGGGGERHPVPHRHGAARGDRVG